jgi:hypothetical protein
VLALRQMQAPPEARRWRTGKEVTETSWILLEYKWPHAQHNHAV